MRMRGLAIGGGRFGGRLERRQRQRDGERRAEPGAGALDGHASAVQLDQVADDREAEPDAALARPASYVLRLAERLEHVRQKLRRDAAAGVGDDDAHVARVALEAELDLAAGRRELD